MHSSIYSDFPNGLERVRQIDEGGLQCMFISVGSREWLRKEGAGMAWQEDEDEEVKGFFWDPWRVRIGGG